MSLDKCVKYNGKIYCWNKETGKIAEILIKDIELSECPEVAILDLMRLLSDSSNKKD